MLYRDGVISLDEFVAWWLSDSSTKQAGSLAYQMHAARQNVQADERDKGGPMGRMLAEAQDPPGNDGRGRSVGRSLGRSGKSGKLTPPQLTPPQSSAAKQHCAPSLQSPATASGAGPVDAELLGVILS